MTNSPVPMKPVIVIYLESDGKRVRSIQTMPMPEPLYDTLVSERARDFDAEHEGVTYTLLRVHADEDSPVLEMIPVVQTLLDDVPKRGDIH